MATTVFPESGDNLTAAAWASLNDAVQGGEDGREYGLWVTDGGGLVASVSAGVALVGGVRMNVDAGTTTLTDNSGNYVYIDTDGTIADSASQPGAGTLFLAYAITVSGSITLIYNHYNNDLDFGYGVVKNRTVYIRKSVDESVNNSTTLQSDDQLKLTGAVGEVWEVTVFMETSIPDYTAGHKLGFTAPSGRFCGFGNVPTTEDDDFVTALGLEDQNESATISASFTMASIGTPGTAEQDALAVSLRGVWAVGDTAGDFAVQWAQGVAYVGNTTVKAGSWLLARRIG